MSYAYKGSRSSSVANRFARTGTGQRRSSQPRNKARHGQYIDPTRFVRVASPIAAEDYTPQHVFTDFALDELLQKNLAAKGYVQPSPIQDKSIEPALAGQDIIGIASTGTGKTAAFALPVLQHLLTRTRKAALIIAPTRELAQQIEDELKALARGSGLFGTLLIGGTSMTNQLRDLRQNPRVVIGTPGRIKDHLNRGSLQLHNFDVVVLDEVDRMLDMGFVTDVTEILSHLAENRQSLFFSATMDARVRKLIDAFTADPLTISLKPSATSENVHQDVVRYQTNSDKLDKLHNILLRSDVSKAIIFDATQRSVERLATELIARGFVADSIHGGKTQGQRQRALNKFKKSEITILVATDVAARGIDVVDISHVINYALPNAYDDYIHRIGRAGRAGREGYALTFITHAN